MRKTVVVIGCLAGLIFSGCSKGTQNSSTTTTQNETAAPSASPSPASPTSLQPSATGVPTSLATSSPAALAQPTFSDLQNTTPDQKLAILDLGALAVLDHTTGQFRPDATIPRRRFIVWLVRTNNALFPDPKLQIRTSTTGKQAFVDVSPRDRDYKYIQGIALAGFAVGADSKHFAPDRALTREEMIAIEEPLDQGGAPSIDVMPGNFGSMGFSDWQSINQRYWGQIYQDRTYGSNIFARVYGNTKLYRPRDSVSRAEAALALAVIRGKKIDNLVHPTPSPTP